MSEALSRIEYDKTDIPRMIEEAQDALIADIGNDPIFRRGPNLARLNQNVTEETYDRIRREKGSLVIRTIVPEYLTWRLAKAADFFITVEVDGQPEPAPIPVPAPIVRQMLAAETAWRLPWLEGIITAPTIDLETGAILSKPGYDRNTGLWFDNRDLPTLPPFEDAPTKVHAVRALAELDDLLKEFCFDTDLDRTVALAMILTTMIRRVLPIAPAFLLDAPDQSNGKTLLGKLPGIIATGIEPGETQWADDSAEQRKAIGAIVMAGDLIVKFDNIVHPIGGAAICMALTASGDYKDRILGVSELMAVPANMVFIFTGNNLTVRDDMATRCVRCRLDAHVEHPEKREFERRQLEVWTRQHRAKLIHAALTIIRAHIFAGKPGEKMTSGRFNEWSTHVAGALMWLGLPDASESQERIKEDDPVRRERREVFGAWYRAYGGDWVTARDIGKITRESFKDKHTPVYDALAALGKVAGNDPGKSQNSAAAMLKLLDGVIVDGMTLQRRASVYQGKATSWRLIPSREEEKSILAELARDDVEPW